MNCVANKECHWGRSGGSAGDSGRGSGAPGAGRLALRRKGIDQRRRLRRRRHSRLLQLDAAGRLLRSRRFRIGLRTSVALLRTGPSHLHR